MVFLRTACACLLGIGMSVADTITLTNGDTLQGTVVSESGERVVFRSDVLPQSFELPRSSVTEIVRSVAVPAESSGAVAAPKAESAGSGGKPPAPAPKSGVSGTKSDSAPEVAAASPPEVKPATDKKKSFLKLPEHWKARLGFGYSDQSSETTESTELSANGKLAFKTKENEAEWKAHYQYRSQEDKRSADRYGASQRLRHRHGDKKALYVQAETKAEVDNVTKKRTQLSQTAGLGYSPIKEKQLTVNVTPGFKAEMITDAEREAQNGKAYKAHVQQDMKWKMTDSVSVGQGLSYSVDPRDTANWDLDFNAYVETAVSEDVNLRLNYKREFLNQSKGAKDKESSQVGAALVWDF